MTPKRKEEMIRRCALGGRVRWSSHSIGKLVLDRLSAQAVAQALTTCELIEDYPILTRHLPDCLVLGWLADALPVHAVAGLDESKDEILVITVYRPKKEEWSDDFKTRRRKT